MIYYIEQRHNPNKHNLMPDEYPWQVSQVPTGSNLEIEISQNNYNSLTASLDITDFLEQTQESASARQQRMQRLWGQRYCNTAIDLVGTRNIDLDKAGTTVDTVSLLQQIGVVKELLLTGSLKTAKTIYSQLSSLFPLYSDIFTKVITDIDAFLTENLFQ